MRNVNLLMLFPMAFASQAANVVDYSQVDLSQVLNPPTTRAFSAPNQPLAYQDASRVKAGSQTLLRKQQLHYGVPVYGQSLVAQVSTQGKVTPVDGKVLTGIDADIGSTLPMLNAKQAIELAKGNSQGFASQAIRDPNAELMIWQDEQQIARLVYKVDFIQMNGMGPSRPITLVDAKSGDVLDRWEGIAFIEAEGPGGLSLIHI